MLSRGTHHYYGRRPEVVRDELGSQPILAFETGQGLLKLAVLFLERRSFSFTASNALL